MLAIISAVSLYLTSGGSLCLVAAACLGICGALGWWRPLSITRRMLAVAFVLCLVGSFTVEFSVPVPNGFVFFPTLAYPLGLFSCVGTAVLLLRKSEGWEDNLVLFSTTATMLIAGNTQFALPLAYAVVCYTFFMLVSLRADNFRFRWSALLSSFLVMGFAIGLAIFFANSQGEFRSFMNSRQWFSASINFGDSAGIKPQSGPAGMKVLMRVFAQDPLPYFASRRYVAYANREWKTASSRSVKETRSHVFASETYQISSEVGKDWKPEHIERVETTTLRPEALPFPLNTKLVEVPLKNAKLSSCGDLLVKKVGSRFKGSYRLARGKGQPVESQELLRDCLEVTVDPYVTNLAQEIAGDKEDKLKVFALQNFFHDNFEYGFGYPFDQADDPVVTFLKEKPAAHCEVYATCMTLMARSVGVPARYVQGFLVREKNSWGGYWVSRERDAHAWVEVYLEGEGWVVVDPTPASVSASVAPASNWSEFADLAKRWFQRLWAQIARGPQALIEDFRDFVASNAVSLLVLVATIFVIVFRRRFRLLYPVSKLQLESGKLDPLVVRMHSLLEEYEGKLGQSRPDDSTLLEWADTVPVGADFLRSYSQIRYSKKLPSADDLEKLERELREVTIGQESRV